MLKKLFLSDSNLCKHFLLQTAAGQPPRPSRGAPAVRGRLELALEVQELVHVHSFLLWSEQALRTFPH